MPSYPPALLPSRPLVTTFLPEFSTERGIRRDLLPLVQEALQDRYTVEREVARGGAGRVFLAVDRSGQKVALKILHPELSVSVTAERFLREIALLSRLDHPLIE